MSKVNVYLADGFEEVEGLTVVDLLRRAGIETDMVSIMGRKEITGARKIPVLADKLFEEQDDPDVIVLPGGMPGAATLGECDDLRKLIVRFAEENKPIAAICAAPMVLGKLGLLKGRKATCYPGFDNFLEGAKYTAAMVEKDGNIITGKGPGAAMEFALAVVELLQGKDKVAELRKAMIV